MCCNILQLELNKKVTKNPQSKWQQHLLVLPPFAHPPVAMNLLCGSLKAIDRRLRWLKFTYSTSFGGCCCCCWWCLFACSQVGRSSLASAFWLFGGSFAQCCLPASRARTHISSSSSKHWLFIGLLGFSILRFSMVSLVVYCKFINLKFDNEQHVPLASKRKYYKKQQQQK